MKMTFDEYDEILEKFEKMPKYVFWPTMEQVEMFRKDPEKWLLFCAYLYEMNPPPATKDEELSRYDMMKFIYDNLFLVDGDDEADEGG